MKAFLILGITLLTAGCIESPGEATPTSSGDTSGPPDMSNDLSSDAGSGDLSLPDVAPPPESMGRVTEDLEFYFAFRELQTAESVADLSPNGRTMAIADTDDLDVGETELALRRGQTHDVDIPPSVWGRVGDNGAFTLEMFVELNLGSSSPLAAIGDSFVIEKDSFQNYKRHLTLRSSSASFQIESAMTASMSHLVLTFDGVTVRVFVDGFLVHSEFSSLPTLEGPFVIGGPETAGAVSLVASYSRALTHPEIVRHFMIGPDPSTQEDAGMSRIEFIRTYRNHPLSDNVTGIQRIATLDQERPNTNAQRFAPYQDQNVLLKFDTSLDQLPVDRTRLVSYLWFETGYFGHPDMSWSLNLHRVTTAWVPTEVSWNQPRDQASWNALGANADYVEEPLYTFTSNGPGQIARKFVVPFDGFPSSWLDGQNYGLIFLSDAEAGNFYDPGASDIHLRPGMMLYGLSSSLPEPPVPVSDVSLQVGERVDVRWTVPGAPSFWYEVYQDGVLVGVTSLANYSVVGDGDESYSVVAADAYGRYAY